MFLLLTITPSGLLTVYSRMPCRPNLRPLGTPRHTPAGSHLLQSRVNKCGRVLGPSISAWSHDRQWSVLGRVVAFNSARENVFSFCSQ
ncbi:hypothetical protein BU23DRAFT_551734 [Bimuria novae-zelandiae CBS 107.79]|uniref:Secreted protein n=1 Tax=Bimuria novae-zelandiae CBS 107.79 TaxID=1447943 RepID=A0A6A5VGI5_9PLEO|nr:hypothetical protein BU23DRAFT_551734 [Bimuria novae-zelandiae CBS 107.79]